MLMHFKHRNFALLDTARLNWPLSAVSGLPAQAVGVLQDGGLWRYGATLTASALAPAHAAAALERWAGHVQTVRSCTPVNMRTAA